MIPATGRLLEQISFLVEIDKLKQVFRKSKLIDGTRYENDAEHSWHLMAMALILVEHANEPGLDLLRVMQMLLVHDLVEIDAGDTFAYDVKGNQEKQEREEAAARRLFGILPEDQAAFVYALWQEFETRETAEAKFAAALDRLQPLLHNFLTGGESWQTYGITLDRALERNRHIASGSETLWKLAEKLLEEAVAKGLMRKE
jgi:putative hydrolase of HD superfamily